MSESEDNRYQNKHGITDSDYDEDENMNDLSDRNYSEEMSNRHE